MIRPRAGGAGPAVPPRHAAPRLLRRWGTEADVPLERYVAGWGRPGTPRSSRSTSSSRSARPGTGSSSRTSPGYGFVDEETPELTIAIVPSRRGRGLGEQLLSALLDRARADGYGEVSLSVEPDNPAIRLYEHHGFAKVGERAARG